VGCLETLISESGLLENFNTLTPKRLRPTGMTPWQSFCEYVNRGGVEPWLEETLDSTARVIAGALNVLGVRRLVVTGHLAELPGCVDYLAARVREGAMWGRFGEIICETAPHRRAAGLVAAGLDRLVLPAGEETGAIFPSLHAQAIT
jgi:predicted NBD/HSP70 family sugar kinase